ncbi:hypothetical protein FDB53_05780 [Clostridium botulinum]|uniref:hypothetical protein n=1 Tax=Clostridium botulinum TaxID=1491 RepID=UPI0007746C85|nr:hypothetical protein [Clostridium botulinum]NFN44751.1 hypothetical protein [Clostridium botulinum]
MGYRFKFNTVNTLAQLVDGNVWGVLDDIFNSEDYGEEIIRNLEELVRGFGRDFYTVNKISISKKKQIIYSLLENLYDLNNITNYIKEVKIEF